MLPWRSDVSISFVSAPAETACSTVAQKPPPVSDALTANSYGRV
jgi:hypothetical protein